MIGKDARKSTSRCCATFTAGSLPRFLSTNFVERSSGSAFRGFEVRIDQVRLRQMHESICGINGSLFRHPGKLPTPTIQRFLLNVGSLTLFLLARTPPIFE